MEYNYCGTPKVGPITLPMPLLEIDEIKVDSEVVEMFYKGECIGGFVGSLYEFEKHLRDEYISRSPAPWER